MENIYDFGIVLLLNYICVNCKIAKSSFRNAK